MYNPSYKKVKKISNQIKPRAQDQIRNSFTPKRANIRSLSDLERERLGSIDGNLTNRRIKIKGAARAPEVINTFVGFWNFDTPDGNEVVNYTFEFTGNLLIEDFGDGTKETYVIGGQTITKSYS
tara:strand:- start:757 stop:1128 length:372 start_codon:yes stop_codon:yes gene_type:complete